jgi:hypothetical protein
MAGLKQSVTREDFEEGLKNNNFEPETLKPTDNCEPQPSDRYSRSAEF